MVEKPKETPIKRKHQLEDEFHQFWQHKEDTFVRWFQKSNKEINERIENEKVTKVQEPNPARCLTVNNQDPTQK